jgi:hypothetical protein
MKGWFSMAQEAPDILSEYKRKYFGTDNYDEVINLERVFNGLMASGPFQKKDIMQAYDFLYQEQPPNADTFIYLFDFLYVGD